jgi:Holliday junction resolvase-like predicted endonuclease
MNRVRVFAPRNWMRKRVGEIDWPAARQDVARFVTVREQASLDLWSEELFQQHIATLGEVLTQR